MNCFCEPLLGQNQVSSRESQVHFRRNSEFFCLGLLVLTKIHSSHFEMSVESAWSRAEPVAENAFTHYRVQMATARTKANPKIKEWDEIERKNLPFLRSIGEMQRVSSSSELVIKNLQMTLKVMLSAWQLPLGRLGWTSLPGIVL